uniref:VP6 protein n=1 Tax=Epizootic hemorrhagic disease virus (serotype 5 / strain CSIRO 157) TaxID=449137 RepID=C8TEB1_9REOV|nr:VP6 protein [Epizootic hemorrhagic disease virus (serotype 5 / strain CSIRO 157)]
MSAAVLLAPGDVIQRSTEELKQRQIQIHVVDWDKGDLKDQKQTEQSADKRDSQKQNEKETQKGGKKEEADEEDANENDVRRLDVTVGHRPSDNRSGERQKGSSDGGGSETKRGDRDDASGTGSNGANRGRWVVGSEEIAQCLQNRYGVSIPVYKAGATGTFINIEKSLQKELGFTREMMAEQTEALRAVKAEMKKSKVERSKNVSAAQKSSLEKKGKGKEDGKEEGVEADEGMVEISSSKQTLKLAVEDVMSQKKLLSMIGGGERREETTRARETSVMLVSNSKDDVERATAYFTAPTGDTNWKEVARLAAKRSNIMAYTSTEEDVKKSFLHLIDHL